MRVAVVGGGPAGLYFAYLWRKRHPAATVRLFEQNPADATWGFGVVFSDRALDFLKEDDPATAHNLSRHMERWRNMTLSVGGERIEIDGVGFAAIGRLRLLELLQDQARAVGVEMKFDTAVHSPADLGEVDLIVGADGINSAVRKGCEDRFKTSIRWGDNKFAWYGTAKRFETLTQTFMATDRGAVTAHHYRYAPDASTFLIECDRATWDRYGFERMSPEDSARVCEEIFAPVLGGCPLISNKSIWRSFPWIWNECWHAGNVVLLGDALHTAHFSIGSGTRLAMEDAIALARALEAEGDVARGLARYQAERRPIVETLVAAAKASAQWYERFQEHMQLSPIDFAHSYITRSGRIDKARLRAMSPGFMARYDAAHPDEG